MKTLPFVKSTSGMKVMASCDAILILAAIILSSYSIWRHESIYFFTTHEPGKLFLNSNLRYVDPLRDSFADVPRGEGHSVGSLSNQSLASCVKEVACETPEGSGDEASRPLSFMCTAWNIKRVQAASSVELPLVYWSQLWTAATWVLHFKQDCRGSSFPLYSSNKQFSESDVTGPPEMQSLYGFVTTPFLAYTDYAVTQVRSI